MWSQDFHGRINDDDDDDDVFHFEKVLQLCSLPLILGLEQRGNEPLIWWCSEAGTSRIVCNQGIADHDEQS